MIGILKSKKSSPMKFKEQSLNTKEPGREHQITLDHTKTTNYRMEIGLNKNRLGNIVRSYCS